MVIDATPDAVFDSMTRADQFHRWFGANVGIEPHVGGNPTHAQVASVLADLEGAEAAMVFASGMATVTTTALALLRSGDHVVAQRRHYGGIPSLLRNLLPKFGVTSTQVDQTDPRAFADVIQSLDALGI